MTITDRPVFDVANDNRRADRPDVHAPITIPPEKDEARRYLASLGVGSGVSITMACANAGLPVERGWHGESTEPPEPKKWKKKKKPKAANDNDPQAWPLIEALRRDGRESDIGVVLRYRSLIEVVAACPYGLHAGEEKEGDNGEHDDVGMAIEARSLRLKGTQEVDKAHATGWSGKRVSGGEISYRETRRTAKQIVSYGQRANQTNPNMGMHQTHSSLRVHLAEGDRIAQIDGRPVLAQLRAALGGLVYTFEDAVLGQWTLTKIGECMGYKHKARSREAKALVYAAIDVIRDEWKRIERRMTEDAAECDRRVIERRAELKAERDRYLGLAA